jgi:hypothetical protein
MSEKPAEITETPLAPRFLWEGPVALLLAGILLILAASFVEARWRKQQPWPEALVMPAQDTAEAQNDTPQDVWPVQLRPVQPEEGLPKHPVLKHLFQELEFTHEKPLTWLIASEEAGPDWKPLLASGRMPEPGAPELLAGPLAWYDTLTLDGTAFTVVGRLSSATPALTIAYALPRAEAWSALFSDEAATKAGLLYTHPDAMADIDFDAAAPLIDGPARAPLPSAATVLIGLAFMAAGGASLYVRLLRFFCRRGKGLLGYAFRALDKHKTIFRAAHGITYGLFFLAAAIAFLLPLENHLLSHFMRSTFEEGALRHIGDAYQSGEVVPAALATFQNNFVLQTLELTFGISLVAVPLGVPKTALNVLVAGFGLSPLWTHQADLFWFHGVTLFLEFEAYALACAAVMYWCRGQWRLFLRAHQRLLKPFLREIGVLLGSVLLTALMLALAALFEAVTLIYLT